MIVLLSVMIACSKSEKETPNGFKYTLVKAGEGEKPKAEQFLIFEYVIKDSKDSVWMNSAEDGFPGAYQIQDTSKATMNTEVGMQQMFRELAEGDSVTITRPLLDFFKNVLGGPAPPNMDTTMTMTCNLKVVDVLEKDEFQPYQAKLIEQKIAKQKTKDAELIEKYLTENNIITVQDTSGVRYIQYTNNGKQKPTVEDCVEVKYRGTLLKDGSEFDAGEISFPLSQVIQGWQIGIPKIGVGDSATFYIPSGLAYGPRGRPTIPPNSVLVFDVYLKSIKKYDPQTRECK